MSKFGLSSQSGGGGIVEAEEAEEDVGLVELESLDTGWGLALFGVAELDDSSLIEGSCGLGVVSLEASVARKRFQVCGDNDMGFEYDRGVHRFI
jgi:hypothetical protein